jgi:hypothetical protein
MGKSKDLALEIQKREYNSQQEEEPVYYPSDIPCPNCMKLGLVHPNATQYSCKSCGQEFIMVGKALRFK